MVQVFAVTYPLTEAAAKKAKAEEEKRLLDKLDREKSYFANLAFKTKSWFRLISNMNETKTNSISYITNGFKITIEKY